MSTPTIKVASPLFAGGFLIINAADFDPNIHTRFDEAASAAPSGASPAMAPGAGEPATSPATPAGENPPTQTEPAPGPTPEAVLGGKAADAIAAIKKVESLELLSALYTYEAANAARKTVADAINARQVELTAAQ